SVASQRIMSRFHPSRRNFLRAAGAVAGTTLLSPPSLLGQSVMAGENGAASQSEGPLVARPEWATMDQGDLGRLRRQIDPWQPYPSRPRPARVGTNFLFARHPLASTRVPPLIQSSQYLTCGDSA